MKIEDQVFSRLDYELTVLMPCLNEAETLGICITKAQSYLSRSGVEGEIVIADNGSTDGSQQIAKALGARVIDVAERGYGSALIAGIEASRSRYVIMGDSDDSYDFSRLEQFVDALRKGNDLVIGNRFKGGIAPGAMPPLHRYLGNPVLSGIGRLFFKINIGDFHCGLRGFSRDAVAALQLQCKGMEFASEMIVKASLRGLTIAEVPTTLSPDGRSRPPHLRSWRDGWRHLRFLLLFSPRWLFYYPGLILVLLGVMGQIMIGPGPLRIGELTLDVHTMLYAAAATIVGTQLIMFAVFGRIIAVNQGVLPRTTTIEAVKRRWSLESGLVMGALLMFCGIGLSIASVLIWQHLQFGELDPQIGMRLVIPSMCLTVVGAQVSFGSFFLGLVDLKG